MLREQLKLRHRHTRKYAQRHKRPVAVQRPTRLLRNTAYASPTIRAEASRDRVAGSSVRVLECLVVLMRILHGNVGSGKAEDVCSRRAGELAAVRAVAGVAIGLCEEVFLG